LQPVKTVLSCYSIF